MADELPSPSLPQPLRAPPSVVHRTRRTTSHFPPKDVFFLFIIFFFVRQRLRVTVTGQGQLGAASSKNEIEYSSSMSESRRVPLAPVRPAARDTTCGKKDFGRGPLSRRHHGWGRKSGCGFAILQVDHEGFNSGNGEKLSYTQAACLALLGCCLVSLHFRCRILRSHIVRSPLRVISQT